MKKVISNLILFISLCSFIFSGYKIYNYLKDEKAQNKLNNTIVELAVKKNDNDSNNLINNLPLDVNFNSLKGQNKDIVGWIYSEGTQINYPIVQAKDNNYYLRRLIDGSYNIAGTLFMDYRNNKNFNDNNTIIYGHNMKNGSMFGTLNNYKKQEYYEEHKEMYLFTENKNFKIELFAGYITSSESEIYNITSNSKTYERIINNAIKNSTFKSDVKVSEEDKIITLSTCSYNFEDARYVLLGVLREIKD